MPSLDSSLRDYFRGRPDVEMAFVFGSRGRAQEHANSDLDIAVYFTPLGRQVEWEVDRAYPAERDVWNAVETIAEIETDFIVLNRCPATLADTILREGQTLAMRDVRLHTQFLLMVSDEAERFRRDTLEMWAMKDASLGYDDARRQRLARTRDVIWQELSLRELFVDMDRGTYHGDPKTRLAVERWIENLVNASIDAAKILLVGHDIRVPHTYRETLEALGRLPGFETDISERLGEFARLRNVLAHEYLDVKFDQIAAFLGSAEPIFERFIAFLRAEVRGSGTVE